MLSLYAHGKTMREIQKHLVDLYQVEIAPECISAVTNEVMEEVTAWQQRPLEPCYPVVIFDALRVKIRDESTVRNKAVYLALEITLAGMKDEVGLWVEQTEGAKFWPHVMTELRARGVDDVLIALIDGLTGFPEAVNAVFSETQNRACVVHLVRNSLGFVSSRDRKHVAALLREIHHAETVAGAEAALARFAGSAEGGALSGDRAALAATVSLRHSGLCLPARDPAHHDDDQRDRESPQSAPEDHQVQDPLPE